MSGITPIQLPSLTSLEGVKQDTPVSKGSDVGGAFCEEPVRSPPRKSRWSISRSFLQTAR